MRLLCQGLPIKQGTEAWSRCIVGGIPLLLLLLGITQCPADGVLEHSEESLVVEQFFVVTYLEIDIASFLGLVHPNDRMVAHLYGCIDAIRVLIHTGQHTDIATWATIIGVPLVFCHTECTGHTLHHRMLYVLLDDRTVGQRCDVVLPTDVTHEVAVPLPHGACTKDVTQERGMMETYVATLALVNVLLEVGAGLFAPCLWRTIGRIVELQDELKLVQVALLRLAQVADISHLDVQSLGMSLKPLLGSITKTLVRRSLLGNDQYLAHLCVFLVLRLQTNKGEHKK